ncbi:MAG: hypothetical protein ACKPKO_53260, partial [Candidatus Fonsibacter sp.]
MTVPGEVALNILEDPIQRTKRATIASGSAAVMKRLLDPKKWARDQRLWELGKKLAVELGAQQFVDHNEFVE